MRLPADLRLRLQRVRPLAEVGLVCALLGLLPFSTCASQHLLGVPCPGCGFTRALVALARGDLGASLGFHPVAVPLLLGLGVFVSAALALPASSPRWPRVVAWASTGAAALLGAVWVLRLAGLLPRV